MSEQNDLQNQNGKDSGTDHPFFSCFLSACTTDGRANTLDCKLQVPMHTASFLYFKKHDWVHNAYSYL